MDNTGLHTSFIPKQSAPKRKPKRSPMGFLVVIGFVILLISLGGWGWAYLNRETAIESRDQYKADLESKEDAFNTNFLNELENLDFKLRAANTLLDEHVAVTPFMSLLERETLVDIRYRSMAVNERDGRYYVKLIGEALSYEAIALQSDAFSASDSVINPVFSGLVLRDDGRVDFSLDFIINRELLSFRQYVGGSQVSNTQE